MQGQPGVVLAHYGQASLVESASGDIIRCTTRRNLPRTVCGDRVLWASSNPREGTITRILDRKSTLVRPDHNNRPRPVAANIDQIVVVIASKPSFEYGMLDRYLAAAELLDVSPAIVVNKCDLLDAESRERLEQRLSLYRDIGYPLLFTSTQTTDGMKDLYSALKMHTSILVGQSGVGKSSLVQTLLPDLDIRVGNLSQVTGLGRHTTTVAMLYHLQDGGDLIDSPGVRDFTLCHVNPEDLAHGFREFTPFIGQCRFHNCRHLSEPGCAVADAARRGEIHPQRLENYRSLVKAMNASA
ncbi:ribosome biogenesis GTPase [Thiogranum longum]|uniref:Small ribosomal subunit biogenesis GTPase RsgA n=2 Tax=Thiogranum longum TaxID=1537524 RepID=A0A4R1HL15_9GAMM|nr:ribosome biogenesis GTPase [Thiogranum longum]